MNRRLFLRAIGTATGALFLPTRFLLKAERFLERERRPLLRDYNHPKYTILADDFGTLHIGDPNEGPSHIPTWREWFLEYQGYQPHEITGSFLEEEWYIDESDLDQRMDEETFLSGYWLRSESSTARAYNFLEDLNIGPRLIDRNGEAVGQLVFYDAPTIGSDSLYAQVDGDLALSCLQWRLEQLGWNCNIRKI